MGLRSLLYRSALWLREDTLKKYETLLQWQTLSSEEIVALQNDRLRGLLDHAYENVPFYTERLAEAGVVSDGDVDLSRFDAVPVLEKDDLREHLDTLTSCDADERGCTVNTSGGSTGDPVRFLQDQEYREWEHAVKLLHDSWVGCRISDPKVRLWGSESDILEGKRSLKGRVARWLRNEALLNSFRMGPQEMDDYVDVINRTEPVKLLAYAESVYDLATYIEENGLDVYSPDAIMTSAGTLHQPMRERIESTFRTRVFDRYGSREVGDIACECNAHTGLHVTAPVHFVEILDENDEPVPPGTAGDVVVTLLTNYSMPLVRYRIGDVAIRSETVCDCGCAWPLLDSIKGRVTDTFVTRDGTHVHGEYFTHLFYHRYWIQKFKVIQTDFDTILIKIVAGEWIEEELAEIRDAIHKVMGDDCEVVFEQVDEIPATPSGKYRYTVSEVHEKANRISGDVDPPL